VPELSGRAWITGFATYVVAGDDPFPEGFTVGDIWGKSVDGPLHAPEIER
jgi:proline racemase